MGPLYNPCNTDCMMGQSPGGELIDEAACSVFGVGNDIDDGICMPCFSVASLVTSIHRISPQMVANEFPSTSGDAKVYLARGQMCRYSVNLLLVLDVI